MKSSASFGRRRWALSALVGQHVSLAPAIAEGFLSRKVRLLTAPETLGKPARPHAIASQVCGPQQAPICVPAPPTRPSFDKASACTNTTTTEDSIVRSRSVGYPAASDGVTRASEIASGGPLSGGLLI